MPKRLYELSGNEVAEAVGQYLRAKYPDDPALIDKGTLNISSPARPRGTKPQFQFTFEVES